MRVLIADDDRQVSRWLLRVLKIMGHSAEAVEDGEELLRRVPTFAPDVVVSDIGLPGCDGIRAGLRLRAEYPELPVVLMTGDPTRAEEARRAGFAPVLDKPFALDELSAALSSF